MITFVAAYIVRLIARFLMYFGYWPDIYYDTDLDLVDALLYVFQFVIYNHIPIGVILMLHHKNFRKNNNEKNRAIKRVSKSNAQLNSDETIYLSLHGKTDSDLSAS